MMAIVQTAHFRRDTDEAILYRDEYDIGESYKVARVIHSYKNGAKYLNFSIDKNPEMEYLPEICYYDGYLEREKGFRIETRAYGDRKPDEISKIIAGYQEALEAVRTLEREFE